MKLKPFFGYFGGKYRAALKYPKPQYDTIVEPFAGAAGYSLHYPNYYIVLVEKDPKVAAVWQYLIDATEYQILSLPLLGPEQRISELSGLSDAERWLIGFNINAGSGQAPDKMSTFVKNFRPPWRHRTKDGKPTDDENAPWHEGYENFWGEKRRARIARQVKYIKHWIVECGDYTSASDIGPATWFIDPPYEVAGRSYSESRIDRKHLAEWCQQRSGQVIVCEAEGATWLPFEAFASIKSTPGKKRAGVSKEVVFYREG